MRSMTVFNYLLEAALFGSVLILLVTAVRSLLRRRLGSRAIYAAWLLPAVRLLLPISIPNPGMDALRPGYSVDVAARPVADQIRRRLIDTSFSVSSMVGSSDAGPLHTLAVQTSVGRAGQWALLLWLFVAVGVACWLLWRIERFARRVRRNRVEALTGEDREMLVKLCRRYRVKPLKAYYVDRLPAASVVGVLHPFIAIPLHTPREHLPLILSHQLCHVRSMDPMWGVIRCLCCAVHWFNPLVWMAAWLSWRDSEMACDDSVTARLPDIERLAYANVIVSAGERSGDAMVSADAVGASFTDKHIRQRVTSVISCVRGSRWGIALGSLAAAAVLVISFATGESEPLPTIENVPYVEWTAAAVPLQTDMEAIACARRFLESAFVGENTSPLSFTAYSDADQWLIEARRNTQDQPIRMRFSRSGYLLEYDGTCALNGIVFTDSSYTHRMLTDSVEKYLSAFMTAQVPGSTWTDVRATADVREGDCRVLIGQMRDETGGTVCSFMLQLEPRVRMLYCMSYNETPDSLV